MLLAGLFGQREGFFPTVNVYLAAILACHTLNITNIRIPFLILSWTAPSPALWTASIVWDMDSTRCQKPYTGILGHVESIVPTVVKFARKRCSSCLYTQCIGLDNNTVGKHLLLCCFMKAERNLRPVSKPLALSSDLYCAWADFSGIFWDEISETALPFALTSAKRVSELHALSPSFVSAACSSVFQGDAVIQPCLNS